MIEILRSQGALQVNVLCQKGLADKKKTILILKRVKYKTIINKYVYVSLKQCYFCTLRYKNANQIVGAGVCCQWPCNCSAHGRFSFC